MREWLGTIFKNDEDEREISRGDVFHDVGFAILVLRRENSRWNFISSHFIGANLSRKFNLKRLRFPNI